MQPIPASNVLHWSPNKFSNRTHAVIASKITLFLDPQGNFGMAFTKTEAKAVAKFLKTKRIRACPPGNAKYPIKFDRNRAHGLHTKKSGVAGKKKFSANKDIGNESL